MYFPNKRDKQLDKYGEEKLFLWTFFLWDDAVYGGGCFFWFVRRWRRQREEGCPLSESGMVER